MSAETTDPSETFVRQLSSFLDNLETNRISKFRK